MNKITLSFQGNSKDLVNPHYYSQNSFFVPYPCSLSYSCSPYLVTFPPGSYSISLFGGSGGNTSLTTGGKGGMTQGFATFNKKTSFFLFLGGSGTNREESVHYGGYNGGGSGYDQRGSGGGATDLRKNINDLYSRVLVASGGGGGMENYEKPPVHTNGGDGGGLNGTKGGIGVGQMVGCIGTQDGCKEGNNDTPGLFGHGSNHTGNDFNGGGGSGWWGGGSASGSGGSGGSSYINLPFSGFTRSGSHLGNGFAVITKLNNLRTCQYMRFQHFSIFLFVLSLK